jgi:hypothetical protein
MRNLEVGIARSSEMDGAAATDGGGRNEPPAAIPDEDEEVVVARGVEAFHKPAPAAVTTAGAHGDVQASFAKAGGGLYLRTHESVPEVCNQIEVSTVEDRDEDRCALGAEPEDRRSSPKSPRPRGSRFCSVR